jgi:hypothetical protein
MTVQASSDLKAQITEHIDIATQIECGKNIDTMIEEISKTNFKNLSKEHQYEKNDRINDASIRYWFTVTTLALSALAVACAIASIIFTTGMFTAGIQTIAIVTGFVGVTTAFTLFDKAIYRYLNQSTDQKKKKTVINKLEKKFNEIKTLIRSRIKTLETIETTEVKILRTSEILEQIKRINTLINKVIVQVPQKIIHFSAVDASPLLKHV